MAPLASVAQFEARLGRELAAGVETTRAEALLDDASALIRFEAGGIAWDDPDNVPAVVVAITCTVVKRAFLNPNGYTSETVGEWTGRHEGDGAVATEEVYLTENEKAIIRRAAGLAPLGKIAISRWPEAVCDDTYVDVSPPGKPLPVDPPSGW